MKVRKIMSDNVGACVADDSAAKAVSMMWEKDCGIVPIVANEKVIGVVTDRDIAIFAASQDRLLNQVMLRELIGGKVIVCNKDDSINKALKMMGKHGVRRLPVTDKKGRLKGMISISDILCAPNGKKNGHARVLRTLAALSKPQKIVLRESDN